MTKYIPLHRFALLLFIALMSLSVRALTIPEGTFYFDNSLTGYSHPKFVFGDSSKTYIISLQKTKGSLWQVTISAEMDNMYRYSFADTSLPDGTRDSSFTDVKNYISNTLGEYRTTTTDQEIIVGGTFVPTSGDNWASGSWVSGQASSEAYSGTLPVLFINTDNGIDITSKTDYVAATYYLDNQGIEGYESIGSEDEPLPLRIRGRGNYTWSGFDKKPYRLKLEEKTKLMGMKKSKNWTLMANADDEYIGLRNTIGYEVSRRLGMPWTPDQEAVEVVLNGNYIGLYMLTEKIDIGKNKIDITEQQNNIADADSITGGWLLEIDNYQSTDHPYISLPSSSSSEWITVHSPDTLSVAQSSYIQSQVTKLNNAITTSDTNSTDWEDLIDADQLARFYICQEVLDDAESFHGSCYFYKDLGADEQWHFGPVWDFGNSFRRGNSRKFIYQDPPFGQRWIGDLAKFADFQARVKSVWQTFKGDEYDSLDSYIDDFCQHIAQACTYDAKRWPNYGHSDVDSRKETFKSYLHNRVSWLVSQWGEGVAGIEDINDDDNADANANAKAVYNLQGQRLSTIPHHQIVIINGKKVLTQ